ncbi:STM4011 family radical SAM protein [Myxococcota bacterium]|nr:STM4011 family radical SAM protein [Myxococcota bacterium]
MKLTLLYRGPLSSCNLACGYCPFALREEDEAELARDRDALTRFEAWVATRSADHLAIFFTPWGEALVRPWYREALARLTHHGHVEKVAIQTNLTAPLDGLFAVARTERLGLWATYHPGQVPRARFVARVVAAHEAGVSISAGVVGMREHVEELEALRRALPTSIPVWVNAYKRVDDYYSAETVARIEAVDPLFGLNAVRHASLGRACRTGEDVVSVDGDGRVTRCHFVAERLGNLYTQPIESMLAPRPCPNTTCGCHIGYVHLEHLGLGDVYGAGLLERVPRGRATLPVHTR